VRRRRPGLGRIQQRPEDYLSSFTEDARLLTYPGKRYEDWEVDDPAEKGLEEVRAIRDEIDRRVSELLATLTPEPAVTQS
jgi:protein-tyrosine-phosphatase